MIQEVAQVGAQLTQLVACDGPVVRRPPAQLAKDLGLGFVEFHHLPDASLEPGLQLPVVKFELLAQGRPKTLTQAPPNSPDRQPRDEVGPPGPPPAQTCS